MAFVHRLCAFLFIISTPQLTTGHRVSKNRQMNDSVHMVDLSVLLVSYSFVCNELDSVVYSFV